MSDKAASPSEASPTTFKLRSSSTLSRSPFRISGWSSAITIRISSSTTLIPRFRSTLPTYHGRRSYLGTGGIRIAGVSKQPIELGSSSTLLLSQWNFEQDCRALAWDRPYLELTTKQPRPLAHASQP